ncbi:uncharacterized protein PB18E9.04c-like [Glossina fuscipes]|uniref:Uncharacterized protein PB18E9.04c-like n=1 Tax=Glossina fuscipes TaxID=7396 RepID=A0A9C6DU53_9MUSC|nr:uncharacterized protein PB18E9.04c-like [Glossina fuscipes]
MASLGSYENESNAKHTISTSIGGRCEDPSCFASKLTSPLPKRRSAQFFSAPAVVEKPVLVRGLTSAFQVHGSSAKFADLKNPNDDDSAKTIYRVVPNTHVHVVNYVVVDTDEEDLSKISNADPSTIQKLVAIQKDSAAETLKKLMNAPKVSKTLASTNLSIGSTVSVSAMQTTLHSSTSTTQNPVNSTILSMQNTLNSSPLPVQNTLTASALPMQGSLNSATLPMQNTINSSVLPMQGSINSSTLPMQSTLNSCVLPMQNTLNSSTLPMQSTLNAATLSLQTLLNSSTLPMQNHLNSSTMPMQNSQNVSTLPMQSSLSSSAVSIQNPLHSSYSPVLTTICNKNFQSLSNYPLAPVSSTMSTLNNNSTSISLPLRMHPNLKITAVASAENMPPLASITTPSTPAIPSSIVSSNIIPSTLAGLLNTSPMPLPNVSPLTTMTTPLPPQPQPITAITADAPRKPVFDQMQAELQELRRTVALLAEAQASSQLQQQTTVQRSTKKSRTNTTNNVAS